MHFHHFFSSKDIIVFFWRGHVKNNLQVPPDFYIPDFDEDELDPDERVDRKWNIFCTPYVAYLKTS